MLALNPGDKVFISENIMISYPKKAGKNYCQITLGFEAPIETRILREKVKLRQEQRDQDANNNAI